MDITHLILNTIHTPEWNALLLIGAALLCGSIIGKLAQWCALPQVVGYIVTGILIGKTGFGLINQSVLTMFQPISFFALGLIGFMIGSELKIETFRKYGRQFMIILLSEGIITFVLVTLMISLVGHFIFEDSRLIWAFSLLLGAISSATAPAATTDVIWELRTKGPLTRTIMGIVALDDALALILFSIASTIAGHLIGAGSDISSLIFKPVTEILGGTVLGLFMGWVLDRLSRNSNSEEKVFSLSIGVILVAIGVALLIEVDMLMVMMAMGSSLVNLAPEKSKLIFKMIEKSSPPILIIFFVIVGAGLRLEAFSASVVILTATYVLSRAIGKITGSYAGAVWSNASQSVRKFLPFCLFSQAGVAIGLSILASKRFDGELAQTVVAIITGSTFVVQLLGPTSTKFALQRSGEAGLNVTEDDLIRTSMIKDVFSEECALLPENMMVPEVLKNFYARNDSYMPVVSIEGKINGMIGLSNLKDILTSMDVYEFLLAADIMEPITRVVSDDLSVLELKELMKREGLDHVPVSSPSGEIRGVIEERDLNRFIRKKILELHEKSKD